MIKDRKVNVFSSDKQVDVDAIIEILAENYINFISQVEHKKEVNVTKK